MRKARIEIDKVQGTTWPPESVEHGGETWTLRRIYEKAGYDVDVEQSDQDLPLPPTGTDFDLPTLHRYMTTWRRTGIGWHAHVLIVPRIRYPEGTGFAEPLGVMYDFRTSDLNGVAREGCGLNWQSISQLGPKAYLRTVAHEVGHVFNLFHPKHEQPPLPIGRTIMNQTGDLQGLGGFPENIDYRFSEANQRFLQLAPPDYVRPGGKPFGSRPPSSTGLVADQALSLIPGLTLTISPYANEILLGEPLYLQATLRNDSNAPMLLSDHLTPTSGDLMVIVRDSLNRSKVFRPVYIECWDATQKELLPGEAWSRSFPVFYGAEGHTFSFGGQYELSATYSSTSSPIIGVAVAPPIEIMVQEPNRLADLSVTDLLMSDTAALYLIISGGSHLKGAREALFEVVDRTRGSSISDSVRVALAVDTAMHGTSTEEMHNAYNLLKQPIETSVPMNLKAVRARYLGLTASHLGKEAALQSAHQDFQAAAHRLGESCEEDVSAWVKASRLSPPNNFNE